MKNNSKKPVQQAWKSDLRMGLNSIALGVVLSKPELANYDSIIVTNEIIEKYLSGAKGGLGTIYYPEDKICFITSSDYIPEGVNPLEYISSKGGYEVIDCKQFRDW